MKTKPKSKTSTDWRKIAMALGQKVKFALNFLTVQGGGSGLVVSLDGRHRAKHWKESFADALEMIPGVKVDRDAVHAMSLPKKQRHAWFKKNRPTQ